MLLKKKILFFDKSMFEKAYRGEENILMYAPHTTENFLDTAYTAVTWLIYQHNFPNYNCWLHNNIVIFFKTFYSTIIVIEQKNVSKYKYNFLIILPFLWNEIRLVHGIFKRVILLCNYVIYFIIWRKLNVVK